jgi:MoaA/NifB/PqqE/SkfB family radical SAM enzyme
MGKLIAGIKRKAAETALSQAVRLYSKCSDETLERVWAFMERLARSPDTKREARRMRYLIETGHPGAEWLRRISSQLNPRARSCFLRNLWGKAWFLATDRRGEFKQKHGFLPPWLMVIDTTFRCNLRCEGCWAALYNSESPTRRSRRGDGAKSPDLDFEVLARVMREARDEMGMHFFTITGGEPFIRADGWRLYEEFPDCQFMIYTNGTLLDDGAVKRLAELGNCMLMISIEGTRESTARRRGEGTYEKVLDAMDRLRGAGVLFGFSATPTRENWQEIMTDDFIGLMTEKGCLFGWLFQYVPVGRDPDVGLMVPPPARSEMRTRLYRFREKYPMFLVDFWNDGPEVGGCMAGGRYYLHVTANGDVEPCVFAHFATHNIYESSLTEAVKSPLFTAIREAIPYEGNLLRPCMLIDQPYVARRVWQENGAHPTHPGADSLLTTVAPGLDEYAREMKAIFDPAWEAGDWRRMWPDPPEGWH